MNKRSLLVRKLQLREHDELKIIIHKISSKNVRFFKKMWDFFKNGGIPPKLIFEEKNPTFFEEIL